MIDWLRALSRRNPAQDQGRRGPGPIQVEPLEDRTTPTVSAITSNFNGTAIPAGDDLWFNSVAKVSGLGSQPVHLQVTNQAVDFDAGGTHYHLAVPDTTITFDPSLTTATTSWTGSAWAVATPPKFSGNVFLSGLEYQAVGGLPGGIKNVIWQGDFSADAPNLSVKWQWSAAAYAQFGQTPTDPSTYGVKAVDDPNVDSYHNSDHAGTPEAVKSHVVGGARGGGGSNYTGSYSATAAVVPAVSPPVVSPPSPPPPSPPPPAAQTSSISGYVYAQLPDGTTIPLGGVTVQLLDSAGNLVTTTTTLSDGSYAFAGLAADTYTLQEVIDGNVPGSIASSGQTYSYGGVNPQAGTVAGSPDGQASGSAIGGIQLGSGQAGSDYDFYDYYLPGLQS